MSETANNVEVVRALWSALSDRDWDRIASFFAEESVYYDVPTGPAGAARGPYGIVARLRTHSGGISGSRTHRGFIGARRTDARPSRGSKRRGPNAAPTIC